ncbi:rho GTPase-activating protein 6-like isoform X2 [Myxocyprinus asiaticus]|uniref:rho GTPase-activating protein 6-like isoform X2 n=1 Tax=Myxocyprinus asiaticus TaxID=70543 RepID=UPI0022224B72|nr:rho GTPase-activating protein 6-like isoform X2 [Myxocyprinus asiaticus]
MTRSLAWLVKTSSVEQIWMREHNWFNLLLKSVLLKLFSHLQSKSVTVPSHGVCSGHQFVFFISVMSAHGLLNSVFSCSSTGSKAITKRRVRQTRSLDSALMSNCRAPGEPNGQRSVFWSSTSTGGFMNNQTSSELLAAASRLDPHLSSSSLWSSSDASSLSSAHCDYKSSKRSASRELSLTGSSNIFSPRKWLQRKAPQSGSLSQNTCKSEGDLTWKSSSGHLQAVHIQSLSELERVRLQEVALVKLLKDFDLGCQITIPKDCQKHKKYLRRKLDSLSKEKDKECDPQAFGVPLSQVIFNDRRHKQLQDEREQDVQQDLVDQASSLLHLTGRRANHKELSSSNSSLSSTVETPNATSSPGTPETALRSQRRGGVSVDCITDLDDAHSRLLEALQLSLPAQSHGEKNTRDTKLSLNPIYRQVPRVIDSCCQHLEKYGLQTVGIFRVGSSKKRVRQLRKEFNRGSDVVLDHQHSVHDVAALLKEFLRDMPHPLLTRELYTAFINCASLNCADQHTLMQLLICLLPACNCDTLQCLLHFLSNVANHAEDSLDTEGQEISAELQNEVLLSLMDTDSDVVNYLLRRKTTQSDDSTSSSGEISPYENNSPVLSEWLHPSRQADENLTMSLDALTRNIAVKSRLSPSQEHTGELFYENVWETQHTSLLSRFQDRLLAGSDGHLYNSVSCEASTSNYSNTKQPVCETQTSRVTAECKADLSSPCCSQTTPAPITSTQRTRLSQSEEAVMPPVSPSLAAKQHDGLPVAFGQPVGSTQPHHITSHQEGGSHIVVSTKSFTDEHPNWPMDKWQIWQLLSSETTDTLPETVV